ncbi:MAG: hypothetical protein Q8910_00900 [Bacteroidota bacterium]|nr:hypothetical protein [Bacteroidota bacterium]
MRRDNESGAIIFDLTPEEKVVKDTQEELNTLRDTLNEKIQEADLLIQQLKNAQPV